MNRIKQTIDSLIKAPMLRHMATLVSGTAIAQLIGVLAAPVLSRLYTPADFGVLGTLLAITGVISVISSLKYEMAIVLESDSHKANVLQRLCLIILSGTTLLSAAAFYCAPRWIPGLTDHPELVRILPWGSLLIGLTGLYNIFCYRLNRERNYKAIAQANVVRRIATAATQIIAGFAGATSLGLVLGNGMGCLLCVGVLLPFIRQETGRIHIDAEELKATAQTHYRFAAYSAPQNLMNALSQNMPIYLLGYFFGVEVVGSYFFAMRLLQLPSMLIGQSVRRVFYKEAAVLIDSPGRLLQLFCKTTAGLSIVAIPLMIGVFIAGPNLFARVFGSEWRQAGEFTRWMVLWIGIGLINPPASTLYNVLNRQRFFALYDLCLLGFRIAALIIFGICGNALNAVQGYSVVGIIFNGFMILYIGKILRDAEQTTHEKKMPPHKIYNS